MTPCSYSGAVTPAEKKLTKQKQYPCGQARTISCVRLHPKHTKKTAGATTNHPPVPNRCNLPPNTPLKAPPQDVHLFMVFLGLCNAFVCNHRQSEHVRSAITCNSTLPMPASTKSPEILASQNPMYEPTRPQHTTTKMHAHHMHALAANPLHGQTSVNTQTCTPACGQPRSNLLFDHFSRSQTCVQSCSRMAPEPP
jgi:hypothetical protein